jgi:hypothetical protein
MGHIARIGQVPKGVYAPSGAPPAVWDRGVRWEIPLERVLQTGLISSSVTRTPRHAISPRRLTRIIGWRSCSMISANI